MEIMMSQDIEMGVFMSVPTGKNNLLPREARIAGKNQDHNHHYVVQRVSPQKIRTILRNF